MTSDEVRLKSELEYQLSKTDKSGAPLAIVSAALSIADFDWLLERFRRLLGSASLYERRSVVISIGHVARVNPNARRSDLEALIEQAEADPELQDALEDARSDIETFLAVR